MKIADIAKVAGFWTLMADGNGPKNDDWWELARRIQDGTNPEKVLELVKELIAKFDEEKLRKNPRPDKK